MSSYNATTSPHPNSQQQNPFYTYNHDHDNTVNHPFTGPGNKNNDVHTPIHSNDHNYIDMDSEQYYDTLSSSHHTSSSSPTIPATYYHKICACVSLTRGIVARTLLLWSLIDTADIPYLYVTIVLFEWFFNTYYSYRRDEYFPGSMYNDVHTLYHNQYFTGDYTKHKFSGWLKLRMFLLVISLNLSISIALNSTYTSSSSNTPSESKIISAGKQARILIPLILELFTVLLNTIFTLVIYAEVIIRTIRYIFFLILHLAVPFFPTLTSISHRAILWPIHFHTYKPYTRISLASLQERTHLELGLSDNLQTHPSDDSTYGGDDTEQYSEIGDDLLGIIFFPIYTFVYKWIGY